MTKVCVSCAESKPLSCFNRKGAKYYNSRCKDCQKVYWQSYYADPQKRARHIETSKTHAKARRERLKQLIREGKDKPCADCGVTYPYWVMQFDHLPEHTKTKQLSLMHGGSEEDILREMSKCAVVCANCHCERTHKRRSLRRG